MSKMVDSNHIFKQRIYHNLKIRIFAEKQTSKLGSRYEDGQNIWRGFSFFKANNLKVCFRFSPSLGSCLFNNNQCLTLRTYNQKICVALSDINKLCYDSHDICL